MAATTLLYRQLCAQVSGALREREKTGKGTLVRSALYENTAFLVAQHMAQLAITGEEPPEVTGLARHLRECVVAQPSAEGRILHLAHSQVGPCKPANQETKLCARKREVVWARGKDFIQTS